MINKSKASPCSKYILPVLALVLYAAWCLRFIWETSFVLSGRRYFCLFDDAMISLTYARNLVEGHGFTWARWGAPVEGFTHPLWAFAMVLSQWPILPLNIRPLLVQLASVLFLILNLLVLHRLARKHICTGNPALAWIASIAAACYFPLNYWSLMGMESAVQALLVALALWYAFEIADGGIDRVVALWATFTALVLLRLDMLLIVGVALGYILLRKGVRPQERPSWIKGICIFMLLLSGCQVFRLAYYGDWLPNTYYLKMTGGDPFIRIMRGWLVFLDLLAIIKLSAALALLATLAAWRSRPKLAVLFTAVLAYFAYSIYVGGDAWEFSVMTGNRFQAFVMPLLAVIIAGGADLLLSRAAHSRPLARCAAAACTLFLVLDLNGLLVEKDSGVRFGYALVKEPPFLVTSHKQLINNGITLQAQVPPRTRVAAVWSGIPSYYSDFEMVDTLGYNDREIAKRPWAHQLTQENAYKYLPGHMKYDLEWTIKNRKPMVLLQWWQYWGEKEQLLLTRLGFNRFAMGPFIISTSGEIWVHRELNQNIRLSPLPPAL